MMIGGIMMGIKKELIEKGRKIKKKTDRKGLVIGRVKRGER